MKRSEYDGNFAMPAIIICTISVSRVGKSVLRLIFRNKYLFESKVMNWKHESAVHWILQRVSFHSF